MNCEQIIWGGLGKSFKRCTNDATNKLWCPTWISAAHGWIHICDECAKVFKPQFNIHAKDGVFFWGDDAVAAFEKSR
jgi:hypothetical protein